MATVSTPIFGDGKAHPKYLKVEATVDPDTFLNATGDSMIADRLADFFRRALRQDATQRFPDIYAMRSAWQSVFTPSEDDRLEHMKQLERIRREELLDNSDLDAVFRRPVHSLAYKLAVAAAIVAVVIIVLLAASGQG